MQLERGVDKLNAEDSRGLLDLIDAWMTADENPEMRAAIGRLWAIAQDRRGRGVWCTSFPSNRERRRLQPRRQTAGDGDRPAGAALGPGDRRSRRRAASAGAARGQRAVQP